jgi:hypothetical protein
VPAGYPLQTEAAPAPPPAPSEIPIWST